MLFRSVSLSLDLLGEKRAGSCYHAVNVPPHSLGVPVPPAWPQGIAFSRPGSREWYLVPKTAPSRILRGRVTHPPVVVPQHSSKPAGLYQDDVAAFEDSVIMTEVLLRTRGCLVYELI